MKRAREYIKSPDPFYADKLSKIARVLKQARNSGGLVVLLFLDELTYYRQPSLGSAYEQTGKDQPLAHRSYQWNTPTRVLGALDAVTGRVIYHQGESIGLNVLIEFYIRIRELYPDAHKIYVAQDNWPNHFHADIFAALEQQECDWPLHRLPTWSDEPSENALSKYGHLNLPIQIVPLPTYAPWTNPIEKLWRKLKQDLLHLHRYADQLTELRRRVCAYLDSFASGSAQLIRYVGLSPAD